MLSPKLLKTAVPSVLLFIGIMAAGTLLNLPG